MASGSALILTVVISVLLAVIAVLFILRTSVDSVGTMSVSDNKELAYAVETVVAQLNRELVLDVPGVKTAAQPNGQEYHDYPGSNDLWLANLEPYQGAPDYVWGQVSDLYGSLGALRNNAAATLITDGTPTAAGSLADADGDGVADSVWVRAMAASGSTTHLRTGKGKDIFLALRVVDLGAMLNVNTGHLLMPTSEGSSVTQVNLFSLALRSTAGTNNIGQLEAKLQGGEPSFVLNDYETRVAERLDSPLGMYSPFGIAEELKLRYRYILDFNAATTRMDNNDDLFWKSAWEGGISTPSSDLTDLTRWHPRVIRRDLVPAETADANDPNKYDYRHITTTFNCDRLIDPNGNAMLYINDANESVIYEKLHEVLAVDPNVLAQLAVNIRDYRDGDHKVTAFRPIPPVNSSDPNRVFYGHSSPFMWISEISYSRQLIGPDTYTSYAIELYVPGTVLPANDYRLVVGGVAVYPIPPSNTWGARFYVLRYDDGNLFVPLSDPNADHPSLVTFSEGDMIELQRQALGGSWVTVDSRIVPAGFIPPVGGYTTPVSIRRDISDMRAVRKSWDPVIAALTLGVDNGYNAGGDEIQYFTKDADFTTIGELGNVLIKATNDVGPMDTETSARLDWTAVPFADIARYFTAMEAPAVAGGRIYGRININTAPYFVLAQLPWMLYDYPMTITDPARFERARDVATTRDTPAVKGFKSVAEVLKASLMKDLAADASNIAGPPDFSPDNVADDFEERDIIFSRISNLATVRSDVFCAYILVRLGEDGPQKRIMVILDRSDVRPDPTHTLPFLGNVKVRAFHPVPDPR